MSGNIVVEMVINEVDSVCIAVHTHIPMHVSHSHDFSTWNTWDFILRILIISFSKSTHEKSLGIVGFSLAWKSR